MRTRLLERLSARNGQISLGSGSSSLKVLQTLSVGGKSQIIGAREQGLRLRAAYMMFRAVHPIGNAVQDNGTRIS
jgi:hypothetical protein